MAGFYLDDDEAREDWEAEREAFLRPPEEGDHEQLLLPFDWVPERFYLSNFEKWPVVRDRLNNDEIAMLFQTFEGAQHYKELREAGATDQQAWDANPDNWTRGAA